MIITILCEPRSGSTSLGLWFRKHKDFSVLFEPFTNKNYRGFSDKVTIKNIYDKATWKYKTPHLVIKEVCYDNDFNYEYILSNSDKVIILTRENFKEQTESYLMALNTNIWHSPYKFENKKITDTNYEDLTLNKKCIEKYKNRNYLHITYEELYFENGINKILDYIDTEIKDIKKFPLNKKYRIN